MTLDAILTSPHLIDLILMFTILEGVAITMWLRCRGPTGRPSAVVGMLLPGMCLMLALRASLAGAAWPFVPAALAAALIAHLLDLWMRWRV